MFLQLHLSLDISHFSSETKLLSHPAIFAIWLMEETGDFTYNDKDIGF